jgi:hypothetical protein
VKKIEALILWAILIALIISIGSQLPKAYGRYMDTHFQVPKN